MFQRCRGDMFAMTWIDWEKYEPRRIACLASAERWVSSPISHTCRVCFMSRLLLQHLEDVSEWCLPETCCLNPTVKPPEAEAGKSLNVKVLPTETDKAGISKWLWCISFSKWVFNQKDIQQTRGRVLDHKYWSVSETLGRTGWRNIRRLIQLWQTEDLTWFMDILDHLLTFDLSEGDHTSNTACPGVCGVCALWSGGGSGSP